jgi:hypothetical protein
MFDGWIKAAVEGVLSPLTKLGEKYLQTQTDKEKLKAGVTEVAIKADEAVRKVKLGYWVGRLPLFVAEMSASLYFSAVLLDSFKWSNGFFAPLKLPEWFQPQFAMALGSIFGLSLFERIIRRK